MIYISKGQVCAGSTELILDVVHHGASFRLTGPLAYTWLNGQHEIAQCKTNQETKALRHLVRMGLAEYEDVDSPINRYRMLTRCILCPTQNTRLKLPLRGREKTLMTWLLNAGLRLSTAELVYLSEYGVKPEEHLLHQENRQALVERIYTAANIQDNLLEAQMEKAKERDAVVRTILNLLRKDRVVVL